MQTDQNRIALIPAYQPERTLAELAEALHQAGLQVWIVDDGSGEEYRPVFEAAAGFGTVIYTPVNRGKGAALKTGLAAIAQAAQPPYTVVTVDADGQHRPADVLRVLEEAAARPKALVLGSRDFRGKVPLRSRLGNSLTRLVFRLSTGRRIYDTQTGLRAFSHLQLPLLLDIDGDRYEYEMNVLKEYARAGLELREVPIETVYLEGNRSSHFHPLRDSARIYLEILKFSASSLMSFVLDYGLFCLFSLLSRARYATRLWVLLRCSASHQLQVRRWLLIFSRHIQICL